MCLWRNGSTWEVWRALEMLEFALGCALSNCLRIRIFRARRTSRVHPLSIMMTPVYSEKNMFHCRIRTCDPPMVSYYWFGCSSRSKNKHEWPVLRETVNSHQAIIKLRSHRVSWGTFVSWQKRRPLERFLACEAKVMRFSFFNLSCRQRVGMVAIKIHASDALKLKKKNRHLREQKIDRLAAVLNIWL